MISRSASGRWAVSRPVYSTAQRATIKRIAAPYSGTRMSQVCANPRASGATRGRRDGVGDGLVDSQRKRHPPPVEAQIAALARTQHGVVALRQLLELGLS